MAMAEILWKIGEQTRAYVLLPQENIYIQHSVSYFQDSVTEKVIFVKF